MIVLNNDQLKAISGICINIGNIIFTGTVVGYFVPAYAGRINAGIFLFGLTISMFFWTIGTAILKEEDRK